MSFAPCFSKVTKGMMSGNAGETAHEEFKVNGQYVDTARHDRDRRRRHSFPGCLYREGSNGLSRCNGARLRTQPFFMTSTS